MNSKVVKLPDRHVVLGHAQLLGCGDVVLAEAFDHLNFDLEWVFCPGDHWAILRKLEDIVAKAKSPLKISALLFLGRHGRPQP